MTSGSRLRRRTFAALVLLTFCACTCELPDGLDAGVFACSSDDACAEGWVCVANRCVLESAAGGGSGGGSGAAGGGTAGGGTAGGGTTQPPRYGALRFTTPERTTAPGACSQPLELALFDNAGAAVTAPEDVTVFLGALGLSTFSDARCTAGLTQLTLRHDAGFFLSGAMPGDFTVAATSANADPASVRATIAGARRLVFTTPPAAVQLAGACLPLTVQLRDERDQPTLAPAGGQRVDLSGVPSGLRLSTTASCNGPPPTFVTVSEGASTAGFFVTSRSGRDYTLTASSTGFGQATYALPLRPLVHGGTCDLAAGQVARACAIDPPQLDPSRTFVVFQASSAEHDPGNAGVACVLGDAGSVACQRLDGGGTVAVTWQTAELSDSRVERHEVRCPTDGGSTTLVPLGATLQPGAQLLLTSNYAFGADLNGNDLFTVVPTANQLAVTWATGCNLRRAQVQVVQVPGFTTSRASGGLFGALTAQGGGLPAPGGDSFALATWRTSSQGTGENRLCDRMLRASIASPTSVAVSRAVGNASPACVEYDVNGWQVERVDTGARANVQSFDVMLVNGALTVTRTVNAVDLTRTLVFASGQSGGAGQSAGEGAYDVDGGGYLGEATATLELTSPTQLKVTRASARGAAVFTVYVVELVP